jgi:hypothetical protein
MSRGVGGDFAKEKATFAGLKSVFAFAKSALT